MIPKKTRISKYITLIPKYILIKLKVKPYVKYEVPYFKQKI